MKKTYSFKPLCLLILIFDLILSISLWRIATMASDVFSLMGSLSSLINWAIFLMVGVLGVIVVTVLLYLYYLKTEKVQGILWDAILHTVFSVFFGFQMINLGDSLQGLGGNQTFTTIMGILVFASALLHLFIMLRLDQVIHVTVLDAYLPAGKGQTIQSPPPVHQTVTEDTTAPTQEVKTPAEPVITKEKAIAFLKTKNGKMILGAVIVVVLAFVGYKIWDTFFNKTVIDAFANMTVSYDGYDGAGEAYVDESDIDYDMTNAQLAQFVGDISFDIENNGELSNGDKVTVTAVYSKETAKQLKVVLKEESKQFDVSGLIVKYQSASEIDKTLYQKAYDAALQESTNSSYYDTDSKRTFYKSYYIKENTENIEYQRNYLVFVFKETYQGYDYSTHQDVEKTRYMYYYTNFDSSYDSDDEYMGKSRLYNDAFDYVENEADVLTSLQKQSIADYGNSKVEEVTIPVS